MSLNYLVSHSLVLILSFWYFLESGIDYNLKNDMSLSYFERALLRAPFLMLLLVLATESLPDVLWVIISSGCVVYNL